MLQSSRSRSAFLAVTILAACAEPRPESPLDAEAIVVGAGIAGLSAAVEMGRSGVSVLVVDMNSVPGGHAVLAGGFAIVGTPVQQQAGITDSPELAYRDWMAWTEGGDPYWTRYYAENSREMIHDWIAAMGAPFVRVLAGYDNSVPRFHFTQHGAVDVVLTLVRTALGLRNVRFLWNDKVDRLVVEGGAVTGVELTGLRTGERQTLRAAHVVLATGGFEGDLDRVLSNWMPDLPLPDRLLIGASVHATGSGLDLASAAGGKLTGLDRQYIYIDGVANPRDPAGVLAITVANRDSMWVNAQGRRFTNEAGFDKAILRDLLNQEPSSYWAIFDEAARDKLTMRGAEWVNNPMQGHPLLDDPAVTHKAASLGALAEAAGLPAAALAASVERFNGMVDAGRDTDFGRFAAASEAPPRIERPPFYALQFFPMTRKSMGGVAVDREGRVVDAQGQPVPGLFAAGELTGSVGINGRHGMDGMFLGPAVLTGRVAGRAVVAALDGSRTPFVTKAAAEEPFPAAAQWGPVLTAADLAARLAEAGDGYWHFRTSHTMVLEREYTCERCHSPQVPFFPVDNRASKLAQAEVCGNCHGR